MIQMVPVPPLDLAEIGPIVGQERANRLMAAAAEAQEGFAGRVLMHVNSTAAGGGVAEMLPTLLGYARGSGVDARWAVISGDPAFFEVTKRLHNNIHGHAGDGGALGDEERRAYEATLAANAPDLETALRAGDMVVLHDPQTLGLAPVLRRLGATIVWRCHIGSDAFNSHTYSAWNFLSHYFGDVDAFVFTRSEYRPEQVPAEKTHMITPSIDPLSAKNRPLPDEDVLPILAFAGLIQGPTDGPPVYLRRDGSPERLEHRADIIQLGPPPPADAPLVVQVSRWDRLKDMAGVIVGYAEHVATAGGSSHLIVAGPNVSGVSDDPEGAAELDRCMEVWRGLHHSVRSRIHLACLPVVDVEENAVIVNALQRHATVVVQKSLAEGFGLTVLEAMWKSRPVIASDVGGIAEQIGDSGGGLLLSDPSDLTEFGRLVQKVVDDPDTAAAMGRAAGKRAETFLPDLHLMKWAQVLADVLAAHSTE